MSGHINIRFMTRADLKTVLDIQSLAYSGYFLESEHVITQRFLVSPQTAWIAEVNNIPCAYLIGYWSTFGKINQLDEHFVPAGKPDCLYLHDLAIAPAAQGRGIGKHLIEAAIDLTDGNACKYIALISVQNSKSFWEQFDFNEYKNLFAEQIEKLKAYCVEEHEAFYMVRNL
ncbi:MAG: GNAT family N-acetyltransferase [Chitinophagaceae bacterium]|nr:MAG: GNAT family N-acetyltransferase [Chitinophagaceae bacterium]